MKQETLTKAELKAAVSMLEVELQIRTDRVTALEASLRLAAKTLKSVQDFSPPTTSIIRDEVEEALTALSATLPVAVPR